MANLVVGDDNCSYSRIISAMSNSKNFQVIAKEWRTLASELKCSDDDTVVFTIDRNIKYEGWTSTPILHELLPCFRQKFAKDATLQRLIEVLTKCKFNDLASKVRDEFSYSHQKRTKTEPTTSMQHHSSGEPITTESFLPVNTQSQAATDDASADWPFPRISNSATGKKTMTNADWGARIISAAASPVISLRRGPHTKINDDFYKLPGVKAGNGFALILNIIRYPKEYRKGAQYDSFMLSQLLTQLGYDVVKYDDPHAIYKEDDVKGIVELFREHVRSKKPASVVVFVGCHGKYKDIQTSDGKFANLYKTIVYQFDSEKCPELLHVPKIFIAQCCRSFIATDSGDFREIENAIICFATLPGNLATRKELTGSPYIRTLVDVISKNAHCTHLTAMLDQTNIELSRMNITYEGTSSNHQNSSYEVLPSFGNLYFNCQ